MSSTCQGVHLLNVVVSGLTVIRCPLVRVYNDIPLQRPTATHELCYRPRVGSQGRRNSRYKGRIKIGQELCGSTNKIDSYVLKLNGKYVNIMYRPGCV